VKHLRGKLLRSCHHSSYSGLENFTASRDEGRPIMEKGQACHERLTGRSWGANA